MIELHRLAHEAEPFHLNPDLIVTIESCPDTVVTLSSGQKLLVCEPPEEVVAEIRAWRASVLDDALASAERGGKRRMHAGIPLAVVPGSLGSAPREDPPAAADHRGRLQR